MKYFFYFLLLLTLFAKSIKISAQSVGEEIFKSTCSSCHTIGKGKLVGPDLYNIHNNRDPDWLISFIRSSKTLIDSGDSLAVALYNEYNKIPMPDNKLSDEDIISLIDYIAAQGQHADPGLPQDTTIVTSVITEHTKENSVVGSMLFSGNTPFVNGGSACISCHNIENYNFLGGGTLSLDLTKSYTKLGSQGLKAIISNPPFPVMRVAFNNKKIEEEEVDQLVAFLYFINENVAVDNSMINKDSLTFLLFGIVVAGFLLIYLLLLWGMGKMHKN